jgi:prolipoprotein diacylglyceryltransferase
MDLIYSFIAFLFMLSFLYTIRVIVRKDEGSTGHMVSTALLFCGVFRICMDVFPT